MIFEPNYIELEKAIAIVEDYQFQTELSNSNPEDLKLLKLLKAREQNPKFEYILAEFICGEAVNSFPYRSSYYLTEFFKNLGLKYEHNGTTRRFWVEDVLKQLNIKDIAFIIRKGLFNKRDFRNFAKKENKDFDEIYNAAIEEFRTFIDDSNSEATEIDLAFLLNMNVNTDLLFNQDSNTKDVELNILIKESKSRFLNPKDKQIALEKIWDAFERIKTYFSADKKKSLTILLEQISSEIDKSELESEFRTLTSIGNNYRIRHHEQGKKSLTENDQIDYLYFRVLTLIDLCIKSINKNGN
jgi:hypothetical protein